MGTRTIVAVEALSKSYRARAGELAILRGVGLEVGAGESVAIMGPSGSGKSTLLNILGTLELPDSGRVAIAGEEPFRLGRRELAGFRNRRVGFVFQEHHLLPHCTALENVMVPTLVDAREDFRAAARERALKLLDRVGLVDRLDHRPGELSGGERQRVAIARAMINGPAVLLADEPTGNLDRKTADTVTSLLFELPREGEVALVVVTHSERLAERAGRRFELEEGVLAAH